MADIEHNSIVDPERHEPKGIIAASTKQVYVADGGGLDSGSWEDVLPIGADTATSGQAFISDGAGGGAWKNGGNIYGEMIVASNTASTAVSAAGDATLNTDSDYVKAGTIPGTWSAGVLSGITFNIDELSVTLPGTYQMHFWADLEISNTNTLVGIKFATNDTPPYSQRKLLIQSNSANNVGNIAGSVILENLAVNDTISLYYAADTATNVTVRDAGLVLILLDEL